MEANWFFGVDHPDRDVLLNDLRGAIVYRDRLVSSHTFMAQYLSRTYLLKEVAEFAAAKKTVNAAALKWGYVVKDDLTLSAQGAVKQVRESYDDDAISKTAMYLAQAGAEYRFSEVLAAQLFIRMLGDSLSTTSMGLGVEVSRNVTQGMWAVLGYSSLGISDPDLNTLVDWPRSLYFRLRYQF